MFDIIGVIRKKVFRQKDIGNSIHGEELTEKQTTKMGYFILFIMFISILSSGFWSLSEIKKIPDRPTNIPYCINNLANQFKINSIGNNYYGSYNRNIDYCNSLNSTYPKFDFTGHYNILLPIYNEIVYYQDKKKDAESDKRRLERIQNNNREEYNTSLTEKIAEEDSGLYNKDQITNKIKREREEIQNLELSITKYKNEIDKILNSNVVVIQAFNTYYEQIEKDYKKAYLIYKIYVAVLSLIFLLSVFLILYKLYVKSKRKNSPHTIIFSVATFAYGLVLIISMLTFFYDILPHKLLTLIGEFFSAFTPLFYILQFIYPFLIVGFFGFIVYKIQKRLYSKENLLKRFIQEKKCSKCTNSIDIEKPFCPLCANEIKIECNHCKKLTLKELPFCENCGSENK